ncbi:MAG: hypothetical protein ACLR37_14155 [Enterococcus avium]
MNFIGGFLGICIYQGLRRIVPETKLDKRLIAIGTVMGGPMFRNGTVYHFY